MCRLVYDETVFKRQSRPGDRYEVDESTTHRSEDGTPSHETVEALILTNENS